jgi:hypothetical protein
MGLLADIYLASSDEEALKYDSSQDPFADRLQYKGFTELQLSMLWAIILGVKWEAKFSRQFINVFHTQDGERLICRLPAAMLNDLSNLTPEQVSSAAEKWAATAEMRSKPADSRSIVEGLMVSAQKANETNQSVYLWNSV